MSNGEGQAWAQDREQYERQRQWIRLGFLFACAMVVYVFIAAPIMLALGMEAETHAVIGEQTQEVAFIWGTAFAGLAGTEALRRR